MLVDDHVLFRKGVAALLGLRAGIRVVGEASDGLEALERARELSPDIVLLDVNMPRCTGIEAVQLIKSEFPQIKVIMLTVSEEDKSVFAAIKNGADGYILKNLEPQQLFDFVEGVRRGEAAISGSLAAKVLREFREAERREHVIHSSPESLTAREGEILDQLVKGASNREIADALCISENTVKIHVRNILEKLHLQNRSQAAVFAVRQKMTPEAASGSPGDGSATED